jgi:signal transduction histidine kinase
LSRQLAKQMNGELTVSSETGRGSTFTLRLVASDAGHSDDKSAAAPDKAWN